MGTKEFQTTYKVLKQPIASKNHHPSWKLVTVAVSLLTSQNTGIIQQEIASKQPQKQKSQ